NFVGQVDLITRKAYYWNEDDMGMTFREEEVPADMVDDVEEYRAELVESAAEACEELMDKYLEEGDLSIEEIKRGLRMRTIACEIVPAVCGSSFKNKGVPLVLDAVIEYLPAPTDIPPDRKSTRLNSSHVKISYAVFCLKKKKKKYQHEHNTP